MACCLSAPSHYLNQYWILISEVLWHSLKSNFAARAQGTILYNEFENHTLKIIATSTRGQWLNSYIRNPVPPLSQAELVALHELYREWILWHRVSQNTVVYTPTIPFLCILVGIYFLLAYPISKDNSPYSFAIKICASSKILSNDEMISLFISLHSLQIVNDCVKQLESAVESGNTINLADFMLGLTIRCFAESAMGKGITPQKVENLNEHFAKVSSSESGKCWIFGVWVTESTV